jgi:hypothetical protein
LVATIFVDVETPTAQRAALIGRLTHPAGTNVDMLKVKCTSARYAAHEDAADEPCPGVPAPDAVMTGRVRRDRRGATGTRS